MEVTTNEIWTKLFVAPAISLAIFAKKKRKEIFSDRSSRSSDFFFKFFVLKKKKTFFYKLNNDSKKLSQKKNPLFERTRLKNQKKKDDTKELEKKGFQNNG